MREAAAELLRLLEKYPDLRICQLIGNAVPPAEMKRRNNDLYYVTDEELASWLKKWGARIARDLPKGERE